MYRLAVPHAELLPYIEHYWAVSTNLGEVVDLTVDVHVDARADLVFNFGAPYTRSVTGRKGVTYALSNLDAQRSVPITIVQRGDVAIVGVRFRAGGLGPFVRTPLVRYTNRTPPPADVFGREALELESSLGALGADLDGQRALLDAFFLDRLETGTAYTVFSGAKTAVESAGGLKSVDEIARDAATSTRNLGRLFGQYLGFSPKQFSRIVRFQRALRILMADATTTLGAVSAECGYFDQSHFVKDFRRFTGGVPRGYRGYYPKTGPEDFAPNVVRFVQDRKEE